MLLQLALLAPLEGEWETLQGEKIRGTLVELNQNEAVLKGDQKERKLPLTEILQFSTAISKPRQPRDPREGSAELVDGSRFGFLDVTGEDQGNSLVFKTPRLGTLKLDTKLVRSLRIGPVEGELGAAWNQLAEKRSRDDRLVVRKEKVLDFLTGVIGELDPKSLKFLLENEEINVKRERIYGLLYARPEGPVTRGIQLDVAGMDQFKNIAHISGDAKELKLELSSGTNVTLAPEIVSRLDFSAGKLQYLSEMTPKDVQYQPFFDVIQQFTKDRNLDGGRSVWTARPTRGICLHSKTILKYELPDGFRRFRPWPGSINL
ncbi:MAG: hypothetical protein U0903_07605 [Planctomycetales bacterium]